MHSSTVLFVALFSSLSQQLSDSKHGDLMRRQYAVIQARQFGGPDLSFCYGETAICSECNILFDKCDAFEFQDDPTQWYQCLCGNGYVEADKECHYCAEAYGISDIDNTELNISQCSQYNGGTIAPLPSSVLAAVSAFNATYTGVISGAATGTGGSGAAATSASGGEGTTVAGGATPKTTSSTPKNTQSNSKSASSVSHTATVVQTLNGGSQGTVTEAPTTTQGGAQTSSASTTLKSGGGTGGAQGRNTGVAVAFSMVAVGLSVLCLL